MAPTLLNTSFCKGKDVFLAIIMDVVYSLRALSGSWFLYKMPPFKMCKKKEEYPVVVVGPVLYPSQCQHISLYPVG